MTVITNRTEINRQLLSLIQDVFWSVVRAIKMLVLLSSVSLIAHGWAANQSICGTWISSINDDMGAIWVIYADVNIAKIPGLMKCWHSFREWTSPVSNRFILTTRGDSFQCPKCPEEMLVKLFKTEIGIGWDSQLERSVHWSGKGRDDSDTLLALIRRTVIIEINEGRSTNKLFLPHHTTL